MRAFIALAKPDSTLQQIIAVQHRLAQQLRAQQLDRCVRWTPASNLHLTLRFLGEIDDAQRCTLEQLLAPLAQQHPRLVLFAEELGCFPNTRRPSVIWCGIKGNLAALARLQVDVENAARAIGLPAEAKPFKPHLTIGRLQRSANSSQLQAVGAAVTQQSATIPSPRAATPTVNELLLIQSKLTPSGSIYTPLGVFPLSTCTT